MSTCLHTYPDTFSIFHCFGSKNAQYINQKVIQLSSVKLNEILVFKLNEILVFLFVALFDRFNTTYSSHPICQ